MEINIDEINPMIHCCGNISAWKSENEEGAENEGDPPAGKQNKISINAAFVLVFFSDEMEIICFFIIIFIVEFAFKL